MIELISILPLAVSFILVMGILPVWIKKAKQIGLLWDDMNKWKSEKVAGSGGMVVIAGFLAGVFVYIAYQVFYLKSEEVFLVEIMSLISVILILGGIGFIDDLLGWQHGGLSKRSRIILVGLAAVPLMAIKAGYSVIALPFFGEVNLGLLYPLFLVPLGIIGATTTFNFLAGFNGLEAGQGTIIIFSLGLVAYFTHSVWLFLIAMCMVASLLAFLVYNWFPARVFPGDSLTYGIGGLIAIMSILGNFEKVAVFFFIPYIIETGLKIRGRLKKQSFGKPTEHGTIELRYEKIYGLEHAAIFTLNKLGLRATERKVVVSIWIFQIIVIAIGFYIFREGIFGA